MNIINPILKGFNPDPSICRVGDDYYIAVSTFEWFPGVRIYHSKDLVNWSFISAPLNRTSQLNMLGNPDSGGVWAPCLSYSDGQFWLIFSDVKVVEGDVFKDVTNYLVTCDSIDGEWSDPIYMNTSGFDPSLFHDPVTKKKYFVNMTWDFRPYHHRFYGIVLQEYSPEEKKLVGRKQIIFTGTELGLTEAPHLYFINGWYYLMVAEGGTTYHHAVTVARSKSITGPYEVHPDNPILTSWHAPTAYLQKAGHASLVETDNHKWYLAHLTSRPIKLPKHKLLEHRGYCPLGRETAIQKVEWKNDWPYVVDGPIPSREVEAPYEFVSATKFTHSHLDHFDETILHHDFNTLRIPFSDEIGSLTQRPGFLRLYGRESMHSKFTQSFVARRWESFAFEAETYVEFAPTSFQQLAGLMCYYNTRNWINLHVTYNETKGRVLDILLCDQFKLHMPLYQQEPVIPEDCVGVFLKVIVDHLHLRFAYSFDHQTWHDIPLEFDAYKLSDDYVNDGGAFTGAFVGLFCMDLTGEKLHADFDYFLYKEPVEEASL